MGALKINDFVAVPISEFISGSTIPVDLFVQLSEEKFVLVVKAGSVTQLDRLRNYASKDVQNFFVKKDQYASYVDQNMNIAGILVTNPKLNSKQKTSLLSKSTSAVFHEIESIGVNETAMNHARQISDSMVKLVDSKPDFSDMIRALNNLPGELVRHSVAVSVLCSMIGRELGWEKKGTIEKLALGGILHDIGKKELPADVITKPRARMSFEEIVLYESHPFRGLQLLQGLPTVPQDVLAMAYEHHENALGQGFPRRIRDIRMNPLARIVAVANCFCDLTLRGPQNPSPRSGPEAIQYIEFTMGNPYNKHAFAALKKIVHGNKS